MAIKLLDNEGHPYIRTDGNVKSGQSLIWDEKTQVFRNATPEEARAALGLDEASSRNFNNLVVNDITVRGSFHNEDWSSLPDDIGSGGRSGPVSWDELEGVPSFQAGQAGQILRLNAEHNGLEWDDEQAHPIISDFDITFDNDAANLVKNTTIVAGESGTDFGGNLTFHACFQNIQSIHHGLATIRTRSRFFGQEWTNWVVAFRNIPVSNIIEIERTMPSLTLENGERHQWQIAVRDEHGNIFTSNVVQREIAPTSDQADMSKYAEWGTVSADPGTNWTKPMIDQGKKHDVTDTDESFQVSADVPPGDFFFIVAPHDREPQSISSRIGGESIGAFGRLPASRDPSYTGDIVYYRQNMTSRNLPFRYSVVTQ